MQAASSRHRDQGEIEKRYEREHMPLAKRHLGASSKLVFDKQTAALTGEPAYYHIAEIHFDSVEAMQACAGTKGAQDTLPNAVEISSGGPPVFLVVGQELTATV